jgi:hypothetical protein
MNRDTNGSDFPNDGDFVHRALLGNLPVGVTGALHRTLALPQGKCVFRAE